MTIDWLQGLGALLLGGLGLRCIARALRQRGNGQGTLLVRGVALPAGHPFIARVRRMLWAQGALLLATAGAFLLWGPKAAWLLLPLAASIGISLYRETLLRALERSLRDSSARSSTLSPPASPPRAPD